MTSNSAKVTNLCIECERCDLSCPVFLDIDTNLGEYNKILSAKSQNFSSSQDGGLTNSILQFLFDSGKIDAVIAVGRTINWKAKTLMITSSKDLREFKQVTYSYDPLCTIVAEILKKKYTKIAIVGVGCQIAGTWQLLNNYMHYKEKIKYLIGLICTKSFDHNLLTKFLIDNQVPVRNINKMNIERNILKIEIKKEDSKEKISIPLSKIQHTVRNGCKFCTDVVAFKSDITLGSIGSKNSYNTVIIRTNKGLNLWNQLENSFNIENVKIQEIMRLIKYKLGEVNNHIQSR